MTKKSVHPEEQPRAASRRAAFLFQKERQSFDKLRTNGCPGDIREHELRTNGCPGDIREHELRTNGEWDRQ